MVRNFSLHAQNILWDSFVEPLKLHVSMESGPLHHHIALNSIRGSIKVVNLSPIN